MQHQYKRGLFVVAYFLVGLVIGATVYGPTDTRAYMEIAQLVLENQPLYNHHLAVYPPLFYMILAGMIAPLYYTSPQTLPLSYLSVLILKTLLIGTLVLMSFISVNKKWQMNWQYLVLLSPLPIAGTVLFGQADVLVAIGIVGVFYGINYDRMEIAGAAWIFATSIKIYPVIMVVPLLYHYRTRWREFFTGAAPVGMLTAGLLLAEYPEFVVAFLNSDHGFGFSNQPLHPLSPYFVIREVGIPVTAQFGSAVFAVSIIVALVFSIHTFTSKISLLVPLLPVYYMYPYNPFYRWLPLVCAAGYLGYTRTDVFGIRLRRYAWAVSFIGGSAYLLPVLLSLLTPDPFGSFIIEPPTFGIISTDSLPKLVKGDRRIRLFILHAVIGIWMWAPNSVREKIIDKLPNG